MRTLLAAVALCLGVSVSRAEPPPVIDVDSRGAVRYAVDWPAELGCRASVWVVRDQWKTLRQPWDLKDFRYSPYGPKRTIDSHYEFAEGIVNLHQQIESDTVQYEIKPAASMDVTGVYWFAEFGVDPFAGGEVVVGDRRIPLPQDQQPAAWIGAATGGKFEVRSKDGKKSVIVHLDAPREVRVQDARNFGDQRFQIYVPITEKALAPDQAHQFTARFETAIESDAAPATIKLDTKVTESDFDGFGGNFVYAIDSPTTSLALDSLRLTWARIGMDLNAWEPENDNADPEQTDIAALAARDTEGSKLRTRFDLDAKLFQLAGGRLIASVWTPPAWMFSNGPTKRVIPRDNWDELVECITSYLLHLKKQYGVEPALFSFNESDIGIDVLLNGEEMRDLTKLLGAQFERVGLRTKILLGDSANLEIGLKQIQPTLDDALAMKHIGALAYHPWSGQHEHWAAWADAAQRRGLMLMATEMGDDPSAWQDGSFNSALSTVRLARKYIEQLRDARTQVLLEWEWTDDYTITQRDKQGKLVLSNRGRFLRQLTQTTPTQSRIVKTSCDSNSIMAAAAVSDDGKSAAVHLLNSGGARSVRVVGIPPTLSLATLFVIDALKGELTPRHLEARDGACEFEVPAGSIVTLAFPQIR